MVTGIRDNQAFKDRDNTSLVSKIFDNGYDNNSKISKSLMGKPLLNKQ